MVSPFAEYCEAKVGSRVGRKCRWGCEGLSPAEMQSHLGLDFQRRAKLDGDVAAPGAGFAGGSGKPNWGSSAGMCTGFFDQSTNLGWAIS